MDLIDSPLRYPGGKSRGRIHILPLIPTNTKQVFSPFAGGLNVELALCQLGISVIAADNFGLIVDLWQEALDDASTLADYVEARYLEKFVREDFLRFQKTVHKLPSRFERAAVTYVLNRTSHSGAILRGGYVGHSRFRKSNVETLRKFRCPRLQVYCADFQVTIPDHPELVYADPPYILNGNVKGDNNLYGFPGQSDFDHIALARLLQSRENWILSYRDCREVRSLYSEYRFVALEWTQGMAPSRSGREVIIVSHDIRLPAGTRYFVPKEQALQRSPRIRVTESQL